MSGITDIFHIGPEPESPYTAIGFPRNPFRDDASLAGEGAPFYTGHIKNQLGAIQEWVNAVLGDTSYMPLSIVGPIGTGKSKIVSVMRSRLSKNIGGRRIIADSVRLTDTGYARATIGGVLFMSLESQTQRRWPDTPEGVIPLLWAIINSDGPPPDRPNPVLVSLLETKAVMEEDERIARARDLSLWLRRSPLTPKRSDAIGLPRRLDWEGELIHISCSLIRLAKQWAVLDTYMLFVDQLEDLFGGAFSDLKRSRLLTDLRALMDEIDEGTPIGLVLAWSPEVRTSFLRMSIERELATRYAALYDRIKRRRIDLPYLTRDHVEPFIQVFIGAMEDEQGFDPERQPSVEELSAAAWQRLIDERELIPPDLTTPRNLLDALADVVDYRAGVLSVV